MGTADNAWTLNQLFGCELFHSHLEHVSSKTMSNQHKLLSVCISLLLLLLLPLLLQDRLQGLDQLCCCSAATLLAAAQLMGLQGAPQDGHRAAWEVLWQQGCWPLHP